MELALLVGFEAVALFFIWRVWRAADRPLIRKVLWSAVLLIPLLGIVAYGFTHLNPTEHDYEPPEHPD